MPLTTPVSDAGRLTAAYRAEQARAAASVAAYVALYYRVRVDPNSTASVLAWIEAATARILAGHRFSASRAALFASALRRIELPGASPLTFPARELITEEQVRTSLAVVGPDAFQNKARDIRSRDIDPAEKQILLTQLAKATETKIAGATLRHVQNGARQTTYGAATTDTKTLGWVRVTRDRPCYFCALLASRGLQAGFTYTEDSFDLSDARFTGEGTAKVHDNCQCHLKPVYREDDEYVDRSEFFMELYQEFAQGSGADALKSFRTGYNSWLAGDTTIAA